MPMTRQTVVLCVLGVLGSTAAAAGQPPSFDDVVRNLRSPDAKVRLSAVRLLRESRYPEAAGPVAALVTDPVDQVQLEAIAAERSFFLAEEVPGRKRVGLLMQVRGPATAETVFALGPQAVGTHPVPPELILTLLEAVNDTNRNVRVEAIYTLGTIARPPLAAAAAASLVKALGHDDPAIRAAAARVIGRLQVTTAGDALIAAVNDRTSLVRDAAMRALGAIREPSAVPALTEQLTYYGTGDGALAALDALARIASPPSVPVFKAHLHDRNPLFRRAAAEGLGRTGDTSDLAALQEAAGNDTSPEARAAMAFALQKLGQHYIPRLAEFMTSPKTAGQVSDYLIELGPATVPTLIPLLKDPSPAIRADVATVIGTLGGPGAAAALAPLTADHDADVAAAATRAIERLKARTP